MKYVLTFLMLISVAYAQEPAYTPMRLNYQFRGIKVDSLFLVPSFIDTTAANSSTMKNVAGAMIRTGNDFWMRNAATTAWLQNVNTGSGSTIALNSPDRINGTATNNVNAQMGLWQMRFNGSNAGVRQGTFILDSMDYVFLRSDSIVLDGYNTATADVIFRDLKSISTNTVNTIDLSANTTLAIGSGDSARFSASNKIQILKGVINHVTEGNKYEFKDFNNTFLRIDTLGNFEAGDLTTNQLVMGLSKNDSAFQIRSKAPSTWREGNSGLTSQVKTAYRKTGIDLSGGNDTAFVPGTYIIDDASTNTFFLPDATKYPGQTVYMIVRDDSPTGTISALAGSVFATDDTSYPFKSNSFNTFTSDGYDWWGMWMQP